jgi:galactokinase
VNNIEFKEEDDWANYPKGVMKIIKNKGYNVAGMDILISGNIPNGAGLSSSASLELLTGVIVNELFNEGKIDRVELVKLAQKAENSFVGVNCGIMDQFAVGMGRKNEAILLDCGSLKYNYAKVELGDYTLVIMNTNKRRALNESKYNERRAECDEALEILKKEKPINALCDLTVEEFDKLEALLEKENVRNRAKHAVYENERTKTAYDRLNEGRLLEFGKLLAESHNSLRDLYEVTGKELDTIVEEYLKVPGCIGARMTGAGFGGCAIALVKKDEVNNFINIVKENYAKIIGYEPSFYLSGVGQGTGEIR